MQMCEHVPGTLQKHRGSQSDVVLEGWGYYGYSLVYALVFHPVLCNEKWFTMPQKMEAASCLQKGEI